MVEIFVPGIPRPQGSKDQWVDKNTGKAVMKEAAKGLHKWRRDVAMIAKTKARAVMIGPVHLTLTFVLERPRTSKNVLPTVKPDLDKLTRAIGDALKGIAYVDDAQITRQSVAKRYGI